MESESVGGSPASFSTYLEIYEYVEGATKRDGTSQGPVMVVCSEELVVAQSSILMAIAECSDAQGGANGEGNEERDGRDD